MQVFLLDFLHFFEKSKEMINNIQKDDIGKKLFWEYNKGEDWRAVWLAV